MPLRSPRHGACHILYFPASWTCPHQPSPGSQNSCSPYSTSSLAVALPMSCSTRGASNISAFSLQASLCHLQLSPQSLLSFCPPSPHHRAQAQSSGYYDGRFVLVCSCSDRLILHLLTHSSCFYHVFGLPLAFSTSSGFLLLLPHLPASSCFYHSFRFPFAFYHCFRCAEFSTLLCHLPYCEHQF